MINFPHSNGSQVGTIRERWAIGKETEHRPRPCTRHFAMYDPSVNLAEALKKVWEMAMQSVEEALIN